MWAAADCCVPAPWPGLVREVSVTGPRVWLASHSAGAGREQLVVKQYVMSEALPSFLASPCPMRGLGWPRSVTGPEV